jgi:hypothetical protein
MANRCEGCQRYCCVDFKITTDLFNPPEVREILKKFPFIHRTDFTLVLGPGGQEIAVGVYNCDRFDRETYSCRDYDKISRPPLCQNTGQNSYPHRQCLLKQAV